LANELGQWLGIIIILGLLIAVYRELGAILEPSKSAHDGPPLGTRLPASVRNAAPLKTDHLSVFVGVVTEGCSVCERFLANLERSNAELQNFNVILVAKAATTRYVSELGRLGVRVIVDETGDLTRALNVHATPLILTADRDWRVLRKGVTHRVRDFIGAG